MIFITGDVHGDRSRFSDKRLRKLKKGDSLIICGDLGLIWDGSKREKSFLKRLGKRRYNILFVEGAHENFDELEKYETQEWCGGKTRQISGNLRQLMRGSVFLLSDKKVFAFGGGAGEQNGGTAPCSEETRARYYSLFESETREADERLAEAGNAVDYIVSYEAPQTISEFIDLGSEAGPVGLYLQKKKDSLTFTRWFFGKYHITKVIPPKFFGVFDNISNAADNK